MLILSFFEKKMLFFLSKSTTDKGLEMKPSEYKSIVKETLQKKKQTIKLDKAECDVGSDKYDELDNLEQKTEDVIQEVQVMLIF